MSVRADVETFRNIPIFSECEPAHVQILAFSAVRETYDAGDAVIRQGKQDSAAYLILSGNVELSTAETGPFGSAGPGALLGEVAMIGGSPYSGTAIALESVTAARIDRSLFMRVAAEFPEFGTAVFRALARKLERSVSELARTREGFEKARSFGSL
jgi:CRP-like cAMP-binding protein